MNVLLCGAGGFIGRHIRAALEARGHTVLAGVSDNPSGPGTVRMDFARDTTVEAWLPRLQGVDAIVNAVGVLRDTRARPLQAVHTDTPVALFDACIAAGVKRVVHISALGITRNHTRYAHTKLAAEKHLVTQTRLGKLQGTALRPSIVFGPGGASARLFTRLARLPLIALPGPVITARVQPVQVRELAEVVCALVEDGGDGLPPMIECAGPEAVTVAGFIASLRAQMGRAPARVLRLPDALTRLSAKAGDGLPGPWCSETLAMLATDNVSEAPEFAQLLGRAPVHFSRLLGAE